MASIRTSMASIITPIVPGVLYLLEDFQQLSRMGKHAMRSARNNGLRVRRIGNRAYVHSDDFFAYLNKIDDAGTVGDRSVDR